VCSHGSFPIQLAILR